MLRELGRRLLWLSSCRLLRAILVLLLVGIRVVDVVFPVDDQMMKLLHARGFEGYCTDKHGIEADTSRPNIYLEAIVAFILEDFWCNIGWSSALLGHTVSFRK